MDGIFRHRWNYRLCYTLSSKTLSELSWYFTGPISFANSIDNLITSSSQEYTGQRNAVVKGI